MTTPLDKLEINRTGKIKLARLFSNIVSPPVIFAIVGLVLSLTELPIPDALIWAAISGFIISLMPILFVLWLLKSGRIVELHMSDTKERHLPYLVGVTSGVLMLTIVTLFNGPESLKCLAIFDILALSVLGLINFRWLISFHATAVSAAFLITALVFGWGVSLFILPFVVAVVYVRLYLKRHSPAQVVAGLFLGVISVLILSNLFGCFVCL